MTTATGITSKASATWEGGLKGGRGEFTAGSGSFHAAYSYPTRFEGAKGTNPEELLAAAHAACLSMALAANLERAGTPPDRIATTASCTIAGPRVTRMQLVVRAKVPGIDQAAFAKAAEEAKTGCPVSNALSGIPTVELDAQLE